MFVIAYLKANNIDIKAENPTSTDELGQIVWDVSDIYNKLSGGKTKRSYGFNGRKFAERYFHSEGREQREANFS